MSTANDDLKMKTFRDRSCPENAIEAAFNITPLGNQKLLTCAKGGKERERERGGGFPNCLLCSHFIVFLGHCHSMKSFSCEFCNSIPLLSCHLLFPGLEMIL